MSRSVGDHHHVAGPGSSEAIRRAPSLKQGDEDMVHAPWRHGEYGNYNGPKVAKFLVG
jgi:hypothetical protein